MLRSRLLSDGWTVVPVGGPVPDDVIAAGAVAATVPGTIHTDLLAAGLIPDPYADNNEALLAWIGLTDWRYTSTLTWASDGAEHAELVFLGLDTVAEVSLNGTVIARTENQHRTYRVDVTSLLRDGDNELAVTFRSGVREANRRSLELGARPHVNHHPYNSIRKMACNYGWDWGPDLVTAGIWRPVSLETWSGARLSAVRPVVTVDGVVGTVTVHVDLGSTPSTGGVSIDATVGGSSATVAVAAGETSATLVLTLDEVERWWPRGHGDQPLYDVAVTLRGEADVLDSWTGRVGFRTVAVVAEEQPDTTGFTLVVNDRPIFVKGANWIPDDAFPSRVTRPRYAERLEQAAEAGINLIRVWGGGTYESDDLYDECDERGLLVWQDFLFACAAYSEDEPMRGEVIAEARDNVTRLMRHPSLALWCGNNENVWGFADWGWESRLDGKSWGLGYYTDVLPTIVRELDPERAYVPGSPWSFSLDRHPNDPAHGSMHIWEVWNRQDYTTYLDYSPRFVSEFGWQGPPTWTTMRRSVSDEPLTPESPGMLVHQKAAEGYAKLTGGLVPHLPVPDDMDGWHWAMQLNQARAVAFGIEHFRSLSPHCMGSIVWQLNDCWPVTSWAAVDGDGRRKPLFYALKHAHVDRLVTIQPRSDGSAVVLVNDSDEEWAGVLRTTRQTFDGAIAAERSETVSVAPRSTLVVAVAADISDPARPDTELLVAEFGDARTVSFFTEDRDSALRSDAGTATASRTATGYRVIVTASSALRDVALLVDKVDADATVNDMLVTLLAGESVTFDIASIQEVDPQSFLDESVLKSANQLCGGKV